MDAGTGAGFPGIPLAAAFPDTRFTLVDSTQKKARFVESAVAFSNLDNVKLPPNAPKICFGRVDSASSLPGP